MALNQKLIEAAIRGDRSKRFTIRDDVVRGLMLRVGSRDGIWSFDYRPRGIDPATGRRYASRALRLGTVHGMSLNEARAEAGRVKNAIIGGTDPSAERKARLAAQKTAGRKEVPCSVLLDEFEISLQARGTKERHRKEEVRRAKAAIGSVELLGAAPSSITKSVLLEVIERSPPGSRKARVGSLGRFLRWSMSRGYIDANPLVYLDKGDSPRQPASRDRWLTICELGSVLQAIGNLPVSPVFRDLLLFMIATGCRREEAARMRWSHVDLEKATWHQPSTLTKNARSHDVPLCRLAREALERRIGAAARPVEADAITDQLVFPSPKTGGVVSGWSKLKRTLDAASGVKDWRLHDLRRTFASHCAERGVPEVIADLILNHAASVSRGGVLAIYQKSTRWEDRVRAMRIWQEVVDEATRGSDNANIAPCRTYP